MTTQLQNHWEGVYSKNSATAVSWYAPHLDQSLNYIRRAAPNKDAAIMDVGAGESTLVDDLLSEGYTNLTLLDISGTAVEESRRRLGDQADSVQWRVADVLEAPLEPNSVDVWHDRAVFHFLTEDCQRRRYVEQVLKALKPGGFAVVGTFGPQGPESCSGLPVARYEPQDLHAVFGERFERVADSFEVHITPRGGSQQFVYCFCRRLP